MTFPSPYLGRCIDALPSHLVKRQWSEALTTLIEECAQPLKIEPKGADLQCKVGQDLRTWKAQFDAVSMLAERENVHQPEGHSQMKELGALRARFADACIQRSLEEAWGWALGKNLLRPKTGEDLMPSGLFILGLGKLGGWDLNFSSDVDLVAFFDRDRFPHHPNAGRVEAAGKILARLGRTLTDPLLEGASGKFVWRVDWRLRPDPSVNPLAISTGAGIDYYFFHADPWERLAFAKARPTAGDTEAGQAFLKELNPFIWRRNLDFQALDEIAALKQTIHARHPGLATERERAWRDRGDKWSDWTGYNVKLGVGGIREVEFLAQAFQILWGGRETDLRTTSGPDALERLARAQILEPMRVQKLLDAYWFLRRVENAIQAFQNTQTQELPASDAHRDFVCAMLNIQDYQEFVSALAKHTKNVADEFDALLTDRTGPVAGAGGGDYADKELPGLVPEGFAQSLDPRGQQLWQQLASSAIPVARSTAGRRWLDRLLPWIASLVNQSKDPGSMLSTLVHFLGRQPLSASYLETLVRYRKVRNSLSAAFLVSPAMRTLIEQSPFMIDRLIAGPANDLSLLFDAQRKSVRDQEIWLERLRRLVNEELFDTYARVIDGTECPHRAEAHLTQLASQAIRAQILNIAEQKNLDPNETLGAVNVIAMGKLGMGAMAPMSDLDLIFVNSEADKFPDLRSFMSRFITGMTTKMREGIAYELDLRLRPNGRAGPPAISLAAFESHHEKVAKTWEHLALSAGCVLNFDDGPSTHRLEIRRQEILVKPRDLEQLRLDAGRMLARLRKHRIKADGGGDAERFNVKLRPGGLMETEYMIAFLTLFWADDPSKKAVGVAHDQRPDAWGLSALSKALRFWRDTQWYVRLLGLNDQTKPLEAQLRLFFKLSGFGGLAEFDAAARAHSEYVLGLVTEFLPETQHNAESEFWEQYAERPIRWL